MTTLPRKNPRAGLDENDLDNKERGDTNIVDRIERSIVSTVRLVAKRSNGGYCLVSRITTDATRIIAVVYVTLACSTLSLRIRRYVLLRQVLLRQFIESGCSERRETVSANAYLYSRI